MGRGLVIHGSGNTEVRPSFGVRVRKERRCTEQRADNRSRKVVKGAGKRDTIIIDFSIK